MMILKQSIEFEAVMRKPIGNFASGSGHITGLGEYAGHDAIVIVLPKEAKKR